MIRKAIVDDETGVVLNVIVIEGQADFDPPDGCSLVDATDAAEPGGTYADGRFTRAAPPEVD